MHLLGLSELAVSTILVASVAGAGLVLAVYTLITSVLDKIIKTRRELIAENERRFDDSFESYRAEKTDANLQRLTESHNRLSELRSFPSILSYGVTFTFVFYFISAINAFLWLTSEEAASYEIVQVLFFGLASSLFFGVGIYTIGEVARTIRHEWKSLEEEKEKAERTAGEKLGQFEKDVEEAKRHTTIE